MTLLQRARDNDPEAWNRLVRLYAPLVEHWCRQAGIRDGIEDVRQEVFRAVATGLVNFRRDRPGDTFRGWLRGVTRNKLLAHFRDRQGKPTAAGGSDAHLAMAHVPDPISLTDDDPASEVTGLYHRALELVRAEFEPRSWDAFWRAAVLGHDTSAIAADLGVTPAAVRKAKSRVLHRLKQEVGDLIE